MQKLLMTLALSVSASALVGCKSKDPNAERAEKAAENLAEARDQAAEAAKKVGDEQKDVTDEQKDVAKEQKDVAAAQNDLAGAQAKVDQARADFVSAAQTQLDSIELRLKDAETRWGAPRKGEIAKLRAENENLRKLRAEAADNANADWRATQQKFDAAVKRFDEMFEQTRKDIEDKKK
jgi:uncharacterized phage infection (PIP) family protein YhgE